MQGEHFTTRAPRCLVCGEVIGVYEPLVQVFADGVRESSRAAEPALSGGAGGSLYHAACYQGSAHEDAVADT
jgi:hypothetical protein